MSSSKRNDRNEYGEYSAPSVELPQDVDAEAGVLGSIVEYGGEVVAEVADLLTPDDFYDPRHREIYATALDLWQQRTPIDLLTLTSALARRNLTEAVGGVSYVSGLGNHVPTRYHARAYAKQVEQASVLRRLIKAAAEIAGYAYQRPAVDDAIAYAKAVLESATITHGGRDSTSFGDALTTFLAECDAAIASDVPPGLMSGFTDLDNHLLGFMPGDLIYMCGRPSSGKSSYAGAIAAYAATTLQARGEAGTVEWVSLEMSTTQIVKRLITGWAGINGRIVRSGFRRPDGSRDYETLARMKSAAEQLRAAYGNTLHLYDQRMTMTQVKQHFTTAANRRGLKLGVVDYIGLLDPDDSRQSEYERITNMSRELKALALELHIPIICLVQLNRDCEKRTNKRPMLSDLRSSGGLEQDADFVLGIYRGAMYNAPQARVDERFRMFGEISVLKARDGVRGVTIPTLFEAEYTRPSDWPGDWAWQPYQKINASDDWQAEGGD